MRKLIASAVVLICLSAWAGPIGPVQAEAIAKAFLSRQAGLSSHSLERAHSKRAHTSEQVTTPLYIFNRADGGYVIVAGDDNAPATVLGYNTVGSIDLDNLPPALEDWLSLNARLVESCAVGHTPRRLPQGSFQPVEPLLGDILWGQSAPFNDQCPTYTSGGVTTHYYVGCVATAATQIMRLHQWPQTGTGSKTITVNGTEITADFGATTYDWANMLPSYDGINATAAQRSAVATLAAHFGVAVNMEYLPEGSGAHSMMVPGALRDYFNYDQAVTMRKRDYYDSSEWLRIINDELHAGRPVYYAASSEVGSAGHAFVCDGIDAQGYVHINWGWFGKSNGYFLVNHLDPDDLGIGGGQGGYNRDQEIITGIRPPAQNTFFERPLYNGLSLRLVSQSTDNFGIMATIENFDTKPFTGQIGLAVVRDAQVLEILKAVGVNIAGFDGKRTGMLTMHTIYDIPKAVAQTLPDGPAEVWLTFREDDQSPWQLMRYCRARDSRNNPYVGYFNTTIQNGRIQNLDDTPQLPDVTLLSPLAPQGKVYQGGAALFPLTLRNNSPAVRLKTIVVRFTNTDNPALTYDYENNVSVYDQSTEHVNLLINFDKEMPAGNYRLEAFEKGFPEQMFEQTVEAEPVTVLPARDVPVMRLTQGVQWRRADGTSQTRQGDNVYFALNTRNYGASGNVGVILNLVSLDDTTKRYIYQQANANIATGDNKTLTFYRKMPVDPGQYRIAVSYATDDGLIVDDELNQLYCDTINIEPAADIFLNAVGIDLPDYVVKGEKLNGSITLKANGDHSGYVYVRMRQYTLTNGGILYMGNQQIPDGEEKTINISSRINFDLGRYLILVEARHGSTDGTIGNYAAYYKLIDVVDEPPIQPLFGDIDGDGKVDVQDLNFMLNIMLGVDVKSEYIPRADLDRSGTTDVADVNALINIIIGN